MNLLKEKITDHSIILKLIPQRAPIVMIDTLLYFDETKVVSGLTILENNLFVEYNYLTEPGLIENMAPLLFIQDIIFTLKIYQRQKAILVQ